MSLYNLWRARIAFALAAALYGLSAGAYGLTHGWDRGSALFLTLVPLLCAALVFPWSRADRPPRPEA